MTLFATLALMPAPARAQTSGYGYNAGASPATSQRPWQYSARTYWQPGRGYVYPPGLEPSAQPEPEPAAKPAPTARRPVYAPAPAEIEIETAAVGAASAASSVAEPEAPATGKAGPRPIDRLARQVVKYPSQEAPGTIIVDTSKRYLYLVLSEGKALRYGVGVGREGFAWSGTEYISRKKEWPEWRPPQEMLERRPDLPMFMEGGPDNPLGARALYLGDTLYRIHGSNEPETIGRAVSSGCIRMRNDDVIDLYDRVVIGAKVRVL
ncbi:L,D-transpeptidase family protein [Ancylobacter lacus]|uniref:L,D-transpeptidase family protein n=1 Tax=Ancylobacter lacus TaxID=2579970 RepID=UPI001FEB3ACA|nr:L,D-transpeptidase [Ancylobacter lacus]